jgi:alcohol dehydrogenase (NADP+)
MSRVITVHARCTCGIRQPFQATTIERRDPGPHDVMIDIAYAGICHSDLHYARAEYGRTVFPLVPGHEIAGTVSAVGSAVTKFKVGDRAGIGCFVDSCRACKACLAGLEQYCSGKRTMTYNTPGPDGTPSYGGYSEKIVADENYVIRIPEGIGLENAAPMFCAGITMYSPLRHWNTKPGSRVAIVGMGGLGHVGVQIARAMGASVTVFDLSESKRADALRLGATDFRLASDAAAFSELASSFDLIIATVPANFDMNAYLGLLDVDGTMVSTGVPSRPLSIEAVTLLTNRRSVAGTRSGGIAETQEMIDFCAAHGIGAEVEIIHADRIDAAYERVDAGDVKFRFVIDIATMASPT